jgi:hypothetical protein
MNVCRMWIAGIRFRSSVVIRGHPIVNHATPLHLFLVVDEQIYQVFRQLLLKRPVWIIRKQEDVESQAFRVRVI